MRGIAGPAAVQPIQYLFIDGAYLAMEFKAFGDRWFKGEQIEIDYRALSVGYKKTFFFDCHPPKKETDDPATTTEKWEKKEAFFESIASIAGWHVFNGEAKIRRTRGAEQKEIDVMIAVEMLTNSHRRNMDSLGFISGDLDFRPLVEAVVRDGMEVVLFHGAQASKELRRAADQNVLMDCFWLYSKTTSAFKQGHPFPTVSHHGGAVNRGTGPSFQAKCQKTGEIVAFAYLLNFEFDQHREVVIDEVGTVNGMRYSMTLPNDNIQFLLDVYSFCRHPCKWESLLS